ncbi:PCD-like protein [Diplocarpon rosae]|nr:PCD-like protein [Diplocarpon rosae]
MRPPLFARLQSAPRSYTKYKAYCNSSTCKMSSHHSPTPAFSASYDPSQATRDLTPLLRANGGRWTLTENGKGVQRSFKFKTFKRTWEFMNLIATECASRKHHPEWSNLYNTTFVRWTTHSPPGMSEKDVLMARFCDEKAAECGELEARDEGESEGKERQKELVERVVNEGDCCVPKKGAVP